MDRYAKARRLGAVTEMDEFIPSKLDRNSKIYVAGCRGLVGSAIVRKLRADGFTDVRGHSSAELDLRDRAAVFQYMEACPPDVLVIAAAKVGGIHANNTYPVDFLTENLQIQLNLMDAALQQRVGRVLFLGSSCIYPAAAQQPIKEEYLLTGPLEATNDAYAIAKIAGIVYVQSVRRQYGLPWISAMPTNLYGPGDNFSVESSHVLPAMIRKYDDAVKAGSRQVVNWGSGTPRREFLHVDDLASAALHLLENYDGREQVNIGTGTDVTIRALAQIVAAAVGYSGEVAWDPSKPDGMPRKLLDVSTLNATGWQPSISLEQGIASTVSWYRENMSEARL